jgi:hypothetical protein
VSNKLYLLSKLIFILFVVYCVIHLSGFVEDSERTTVLLDFEEGIPCSEDGDIIGLRHYDKKRVKIVEEGTEKSKKSLSIKIAEENNIPVQRDIFLQGNVRRMYLATKSAKYIEDGPNALSFWVKIKRKNIRNKKKQKIIDVWTYHWREGDYGVGGITNNGNATDSMMHGYSNCYFFGDFENKWLHVVLSPSAFQHSRYYYHFYAARGVTDELKFFSSLRQLQFHIGQDIRKGDEILIDQVKLIYINPTAVFEKDFYSAEITRKKHDFIIPVKIINPTNIDRRYRVFISSFLGVSRENLYKAHITTDSFRPTRLMQDIVGGNGGIGVVELINKDGDSIVKEKKEMFIKAKGLWEGRLVYHIKTEMLGDIKEVKYGRYNFLARRDSLTTSVIVWDPYDNSVNNMKYIKNFPSNADDGNHNPPPGFPLQKKLSKGWRSEDIPINQVGGYFVSVLHLTD